MARQIWRGRDKLIGLKSYQQVRVTRTIVYEGPVYWINQTLTSGRSQILGEGPARMMYNPNWPVGQSLTCTAETIEVLTHAPDPQK